MEPRRSVMEPERDSSLVEILDRLLNKGAVLNADLIITVAGIPLIGLNLRAALASMETMLEYGVMEDWDRNSREQYARQEIKLKLPPGEEILFKAFGYLWQDEGVISHWVPGIWNITSRRIFLWLRSPGKILFEAPLENLRVTRLQALTVEKWALELNFSEGSAQGSTRISLSDMDEFEEALLRAGIVIAGVRIDPVKPNQMATRARGSIRDSFALDRSIH
jgi:Gas vesicle protein.